VAVIGLNHERLIRDICEDRVRACGAVKCIAASKRDKEDCRGSKRPIESRVDVHDFG